MIVWIALNLIGILGQWDPYPFILLNLAFSTQAAYAAPLILLAQNRQDDRDRVALEEDRARATAHHRRHRVPLPRARGRAPGRRRDGHPRLPAQRALRARQRARRRRPGDAEGAQPGGGPVAGQVVRQDAREVARARRRARRREGAVERALERALDRSGVGAAWDEPRGGTRRRRTAPRNIGSWLVHRRSRRSAPHSPVSRTPRSTVRSPSWAWSRTSASSTTARSRSRST